MKVEDFTISTKAKNLLLKNRFKTLDDFKNITLEDLSKIDGLGQKSIYEITSYLLYTHKIKVTKKAKPKDPLFKLKQSIVEKLIKPELLNNYDPAIKKEVWRKNIPLAAKLLAVYPEEEFWNNFDLGFKLNSLFFLLSENGKPKISEKYSVWKMKDNFQETKAETYELSESKTGEDVIVERVPSLKDFLNL